MNNTRKQTQMRDQTGHSRLNLLESVPKELLLVICEFLDLQSLHHVSLLCREWSIFIDSSQYVWKALFDYYRKQDNLVVFRRVSTWKEELRLLLDLKFDNTETQQNILLSSRSAHFLDKYWSTAICKNVLEVPKLADTSYCYEVHLNYFPPRSIPYPNYFSLLIGCWYWDTDLPTEDFQLLGCKNTGLAFYCGNQMLRKRYSWYATQQSVSPRDWPLEDIKSGDIIGVKINMHPSGMKFDMEFYWNGARRVFEKNANRNICARFVQPRFFGTNNTKISIRRVHELYTDDT